MSLGAGAPPLVGMRPGRMRPASATLMSARPHPLMAEAA